MQRIPRTDLIVGHQTHPGETGKNNEDSYTVAAFKASGGKTTITLGMVADGVGGNLAGEVASSIAVETVSQMLEQSEVLDPKEFFTKSFAEITRRIGTYLNDNPEVGNPGTTAAAALIVDRRLYTAYLGDSRIYLLRNGEIRQLSSDHTAIQEAIDNGLLTPDEAEKAVAYHHIIRRYLGAQSDPVPDFRLRLRETETAEQSERNQGYQLLPNDIVLVCTDGLHDLVKPHEIRAALLENSTPQKAVDALVLLARQRGGHDNITIVALQIPAKKGVRTAGAVALIVGGIVLAIVALLVILGLLFFFRGGGDDDPSAATLAPTTSVPLPGGLETLPPDPLTDTPPLLGTTTPDVVGTPGDLSNPGRPTSTAGPGITPTTALDASPTSALESTPPPPRDTSTPGGNTSTPSGGNPTSPPAVAGPTSTSNPIEQTAQAMAETASARDTPTSTPNVPLPTLPFISTP